MRNLYQLLNFARVVTCVVALSLPGCSRRPALVDTLGTAIDEEPFNHLGDPRAHAQIIVVASVIENRVVAKRVPAARYQDVLLDLHLVRCERENSLRGSLAGRELSFFYFADGKYADAKPNPRYKRLFQATPGSRYIFFLTMELGVLRSIGDVGDYQIQVTTGTHSGGFSGDIGTQISEILLIPGGGTDLRGMTQNLPDYAGIADVWGTRPHTVELLRQLLSHGEPLRSAACGTLVLRYRGQGDCVADLAADASESAETRQRALGELKQQNIERRLLIDDLEDPAHLAYVDFGGDSRRRLREELQTLLFARDPLLRQRTCTALKRFYPYNAEPKCSETMKPSGD